MVEQLIAGCVDVDYIVVGMLSNNVYLLDCGEDACVVVDPSSNIDRIIEMINGRHVEAIFITHFHFDHVGAAAALRAKTGAKVYASVIDAPFIEGKKHAEGLLRKVEPCPVDVLVSQDDVVRIGATSWQVIETPGHSGGSICFYAAEGVKEGRPGVLISGDTLFQDAIGNLSFSESVPEAMPSSLAKLKKLPPQTLVLPGHGGLTTIAAEQNGVLRLYCDE